jgi:hypothetical protein
MIWETISRLGGIRQMKTIVYVGLIKSDITFITHRSDFDRMIDEFHNWLQPDSGVMKAIVEVK